MERVTGRLHLRAEGSGLSATLDAATEEQAGAHGSRLGLPGAGVHGALARPAERDAMSLVMQQERRLVR